MALKRLPCQPDPPKIPGQPRRQGSINRDFPPYPHNLIVQFAEQYCDIRFDTRGLRLRVTPGQPVAVQDRLSRSETARRFSTVETLSLKLQEELKRLGPDGIDFLFMYEPATPLHNEFPYYKESPSLASAAQGLLWLALAAREGQARGVGRSDAGRASNDRITRYAALAAEHFHQITLSTPTADVRTEQPARPRKMLFTTFLTQILEAVGELGTSVSIKRAAESGIAAWKASRGLQA